jgi:hypothetical protein
VDYIRKHPARQKVVYSHLFSRSHFDLSWSAASSPILLSSDMTSRAEEAPPGLDSSSFLKTHRGSAAAAPLEVLLLPSAPSALALSMTNRLYSSSSVLALSASLLSVAQSFQAARVGDKEGEDEGRELEDEAGLSAESLTPSNSAAASASFSTDSSSLSHCSVESFFKRASVFSSCRPSAVRSERDSLSIFE